MMSGDQSPPPNSKFLGNISELYKKREEELALQRKLKEEKKQIDDQAKPLVDQLKSSKKRQADIETSLLHEMNSNQRKNLPMPGFNSAVTVERREFKDRMTDQKWMGYIDSYFRENGLMHLQNQFLEEFDPEAVGNVHELWEFIDNIAKKTIVGFQIKQFADANRISTKEVLSIKRLKTDSE